MRFRSGGKVLAFFWLALAFWAGPLRAADLATLRVVKLHHPPFGMVQGHFEKTDSGYDLIIEGLPPGNRDRIPVPPSVVSSLQELADTRRLWTRPQAMGPYAEPSVPLKSDGDIELYVNFEGNSWKVGAFFKPTAALTPGVEAERVREEFLSTQGEKSKPIKFLTAFVPTGAKQKKTSKQGGQAGNAINPHQVLGLTKSRADSYFRVSDKQWVEVFVLSQDAETCKFAPMDAMQAFLNGESASLTVYEAPNRLFARAKPLAATEFSKPLTPQVQAILGGLLHRDFAGGDDRAEALRQIQAKARIGHLSASPWDGAWSCGGSYGSFVQHPSTN